MTSGSLLLHRSSWCRVELRGTLITCTVGMRQGNVNLTYLQTAALGAV